MDNNSTAGLYKGGTRFQCPICKRHFVLAAGEPRPGWFPFCSDRCKLVDLAAWLDGHYRIVAPLEQGPEDTQ